MLKEEELVHLLYCAGLCFFVFFVLTSIVSCNETLIKERDLLPSNGQTVSFNHINQAIIQPYCIKCHGPNSNTGIELTTAEEVQSYGDTLCDVVKNKSMPPSANLPEKLQEMLCKWVKDASA